MTGRLSPHVVHVGFFNDPQGRMPHELLRAWPTLVDVAEAACDAGVRLSVVQACAHREELTQNGVRYHFLPCGVEAAPGGMGELAGLLRALAPELLHVHGLGFCREVLALASLLPGVPLLLQDHASRPPRIWRRALWRRSLAAASGVAFCALEQAAPFARAGLLSTRMPIYAIPESTSRFSPGDRREARRATGVTGEPAVLWVGHLDANKDPLTVLEGVSEALQALPGLRLFCCYGVAPLLRQVESRVTADPQLRGRVQLLGRVAHETVEQLMRAADIFVLGSHREGSGYSLIESLACGLPPVVTDIPSFRALTGEGAVGRLWPCGDRSGLRAGLEAMARTGSEARRAVRAHFERELSRAALGAKLAAMYHDALARSRSARTLPLRQALR